MCIIKCTYFIISLIYLCTCLSLNLNSINDFVSQQVAKFLMKTVSQVRSGNQIPSGTAAYLGNRLLMKENCKVMKGNSDPIAPLLLDSLVEGKRPSHGNLVRCWGMIYFRLSIELLLFVFPSTNFF